jgi:hypothetical protein
LNPDCLESLIHHAPVLHFESPAAKEYVAC